MFFLHNAFFYLFISVFYDRIKEKIKEFYMKKIMNKINFAIIGMMVACPAFAAAEAEADPLCDLIKSLKGIFGILRTLAFVGAAFYIAGWAWDFISKGKAEVKDLKDKGTGLLVGFILLFSIGLILSFLLSAAGGNALGCKADITSAW